MPSNIVINETWQSINTLSGIPVGSEMSIQNKSTPWVYVADEGQPTEDSREGYLIAPFDHTESSFIFVTKGSPEVWARTLRWEANLFVQEL